MRRLPVLAAGVAGALLLAGATAPAAQDLKPLQIFFVDVEGGAATLMVTPAGESVLVDSGWPGLEDRDPKRIQHAAELAGVRQIDHYVTTHWHTDHYGGIAGLAKRMPVKRYWNRGVPQTLDDDPKGFPVLMGAYQQASHGVSTALNAGDTIPLQAGGEPVSLQVVAANTKVIGEGATELAGSCAKHPGKPVDPSDNAKSLALLLHYGKFDFLNCGDLTWNIEHKLVCPTNRVGPVDLWQVTHHGADQSNNPALVQAIEPRCAVMVNGARKGGAPETVRTIKAQKSIQQFYALHNNATSAAEDNAAPDHVANPQEKCEGRFLQVTVSPNADRYQVRINGEGTPGELRVR